MPNQTTFFPSSFFYPWVFHDDGVTPHGRYAKEMHSMRIPFPQHADNGWYHIKNFYVLHLAHIYPLRVLSKWRFYQCLELYKGLFNNPISSYRSYNYQFEHQLLLPKEWITFDDGSSFFDILDLEITNFWFDDEVIKMINEKGAHFFSILPIWDSKWLKEFSHLNKKFNDPRNIFKKFLHLYLHSTQRYYPNKVIRFVDALYKRFHRLKLYFIK
jgi:hypothetical protein